MNKYYPNTFKPLKVRNVTFKNRVFSAPNMISWVTGEHLPDDNFIRYYEGKAAGGPAQVTVAGGMIDEDICELGGAYWSFTRRILPRFAELAKSIKRHGAAASLELCHGGAFYPVDKLGRNPVGPSAFVREDGVQIEEMTVERMNEIADKFAAAAELAQIAGFDGVMIHGAHGWGLAQFLSDEFNKRTDEYGGSMENRARYPAMVCDRVREKCGPNFLIEYRVSGDELCEGGHTLEQTVEFCKIIQNHVDIIHVSAARDSTDDGAVITHPTIFLKNGCNAYMAAAIKKAVDIPVVAIGAINTPELIEEILATGGADFVAAARAFIADPGFVNKARTGRRDDIIPCIRCLDCLTGLQMTDSFNCSVNPCTGRELLLQIPPAKERRSVVVVGGGPAGMNAACTAADRGHEVILLEKTDSLGGLLKFTEYDDLKADLRRFKDYLINRTKKLNIDIIYNTEGTAELIEKLNPDAVIVAVGSSPITPPVPGLKENATHALDIYERLDTLGENVVMIGGGLVGCETGIYLAELGKKVTIVEMQETLAPDANWMSQEGMLVPLAKYDIQVCTSTTCLEILKDGVKVKNPDGSERVIPADSIVYAMGMRANEGPMEELRYSATDVVPVGDCVRARRVPNAVHEAFFAVSYLS